MKRKEDKYDGNQAVAVANTLFVQNQEQVNKMVIDNAISLLESAYRSGYTKALEDYGIEVFPKNITSKETIEVEE